MNEHGGSAASTTSAIELARTVVVMRLRDHSQSVRIATVFAEEGLRVMEVTLDHADSLTALGGISRALGDEVVLGAGTVRTVEQVHLAAAAGARFCVSPNTDPVVIAATLAEGLVSIPGACTPTEIVLAIEAGADLVKIFPAGPLGPGYLKVLQGPFRGVKFVPTGGIPHDQLSPWYEAGAVAIGLGSDLIVTNDFTELRRRAAVVFEQAQGGTS